MQKSSRIQQTVFAVTTLVAIAFTQTGHAAGLRDWLWGRSPYYQSPAAYRAPNGYWTHSPWARASAYPAQLVPAAVPPTVTIPTQSQAATRVAPSTVPSTAIAGFSPTTFNSATACNPCGQVAATPNACQPVAQYAQPIRYYYRARPRYRSTWYRVPVTTYRPVTVMSPFAAGPVSQLQPCNTYTWQHRRVPVSTFRPFYGYGYRQPAQYTVPSFFSQPAASACGTCTTGSTPAVAPYYSTPASPMGPIPATPSTPMNPNEPASQPPQLNPGEVQPQAGRSRLGSGLTGAVPTSRPSRSRPSSSVVPIPDPAGDADRNRARIEAPALLGPRDHTAEYRPVAGAVTPIVWNVERRVPSSQQPKDQAWDDGGWESAAR